MFIRDVLLPRSILVNAALYAVVALLYTITFFALETTSPGKYVFSDSTESSRLRRIFSYLVICSWPVLLFGALILIAVRVGGRVRRRRRHKRSKESKTKPTSLPDDNAESPRKQPPSTIPPSHINDPSSIPPNPSRPLTAQSNTPNSLVGEASAPRSKPSRSTSKKPRVAKGYVSVTRPQRIFAALGFLWVSVGLAASAAAAVIVFFGQRKRYQEQAVELGTDSEEWKSWVIPIVSGILLAVVFTILSVTTLLKVFTTLAARGREIETPAQSENEDSVGDLDDEDMLFADGEPTAPPLTPVVSEAHPAQPAPVVRGRVRMGNNAYHSPKKLPYQPNQKTVDRMMRQLRDMGFPSPHQNLAALQASSFDLERAREKLTNAQGE